MINLINTITKQQNTALNRQLAQLPIQEKGRAIIVNNQPQTELSQQLQQLENDYKYLIICALNNRSYFAGLYKCYKMIRYFLPFLTPLPACNLISPAQLTKILPSGYQIHAANYFSFIPVRTSKIAQQIEYIGQRWFARFANCYIITYKKI